jgi:uncharacterized protein with NAD-binding domain and iron-sulfur cluster
MSASNPSGKRRIVILGGGVSGMATAMKLTDPENPESRNLDVTVYQIGWRLGGKGASGRNLDPALNYRIEEHGLHVWFGCYDNAFRMIRRCYDELGRAPDAPLARWTDAFKPHTAGGTLDFVNGQWRAWLEAFPTNTAVPGEGDLLPLGEYAREGMKLIWHLLHRSPHARPSPTGADHLDLPGARGRREQHRLSALEDRIFRALVWLLRKVHGLAVLLRFGEWAMLRIAGLFLRWRWSRIRGRVRGGTPASTSDRHSWLFVNAIYAVLRGFAENHTLERGLRSLNGVDFREWLGRYAIDDGGFTIDSDWLRGIYDGMFAYVDGDNRTPEGARFPPNAKMEAGVALLCGLRQYATYKGAAVWRMQAGMGDTIFAPMYQVLRRRGVKFRFFHKVEALRSADGRSLTSIEIARQATVRPEREAGGGYEPLIAVKGLPCWPSTPLYDQLLEGDELRERAIDLESYATPWEPVGRITLRAGQDFDEAVLAISIGALPYLCCDLIGANAKWRDMIRHIRTNRTLSAQFWFGATASELGWALMQRPLISAYDITFLDTWADMSYLIHRENWHAAAATAANRPATAASGAGASDGSGRCYPLNLSYFCGPMPDEPLLEMTECGPIAPISALDQQRENARAKEIARTLVETQIGTFFPRAFSDGPDPRFRWELLVDARPGVHEGPDRFEAQYFRANVQPAERYVLSVPGSDQYRLPPGASGFARLTLAGDWTDCGMNAGCVEGAVMSALLASNALTGYPARSEIVGLDWY